MYCGIADPTRWNGSPKLRVPCSRDRAEPNDKKSAGSLWRIPGLSILVSTALIFSSPQAVAQFLQQGPKLVGVGASGPASQGSSVALSGDGSTAIVGGPGDKGGLGAAWVFTRSGIVWTQQGNKLMGAGAIGFSQQGSSVSLSADGNTAIVGGPRNDTGKGAAWVFVRKAVTGIWIQQSKLVGMEAMGNAQQGFSVSLSADGNTAIVGGPNDDGNKGTAWVFVRKIGVWGQQGHKLVGTGAAPPARQGRSVGMSGDGYRAIVGGFKDNGDKGAAWVWARSAGTVFQDKTK